MTLGPPPFLALTMSTCLTSSPRLHIYIFTFFTVLDNTHDFIFPRPFLLFFCLTMDVVQFQTHSCDQCQKVIFDLHHEFEKSAKAVFDLKDQLEKGTFSANPQPKTNQKDEANMAEKGALFDLTFGELYTSTTAGCQLFNQIIDDEQISQETIHSLTLRDIIINDLNQKLRWAFRDSSLQFDGWLRELCLENTLHKIHPSLGDSLNQCRLWASTY